MQCQSPSAGSSTPHPTPHMTHFYYTPMGSAFQSTSEKKKQSQRLFTRPKLESLWTCFRKPICSYFTPIPEWMDFTFKSLITMSVIKSEGCLPSRSWPSLAWGTCWPLKQSECQASIRSDGSDYIDIKAKWGDGVWAKQFGWQRATNTGEHGKLPIKGCSPWPSHTKQCPLFIASIN